jgi:rhamnose transport system permease protein
MAAEPSTTTARLGARRLLRWESVLVLLLVAVAVGGSLAEPGFLSGSNLFYLGLDVGEIALMALPLTLVVVAGEIDLSIASILGLSSALIGFLWNAGWALEVIFPTVVLVGAVAGLGNGLLVTRLGLPSLAVTIGTLALYRGLAFVVLGDQAVADFPAKYTRYGINPIPGTHVPYPIVLFAVLAVVSAVVLHATPFGRSVFAIGANQEAAFFSGIRVKRTKFILYVASGAVSALAGIVFTLRFASARADNGAGLELAVVAAVLLGGVSIFGGKGTLGGVVAAVFLLGGIRSALILNDVSNDILSVVTGLLLIGSVIAPNVIAAVSRAVSRRRAASSSARPEPARAG